MHITIKEKKKGFFSFLKREKGAHIDCRRTIGKTLGFCEGGYKTNISADPELVERGEVRNLVELLEKEGRENGEPFGIPTQVPEGYILIVDGTSRELKANKRFLKHVKEKLDSEYSDRFDDYIQSFEGFFSLGIDGRKIKEFSLSRIAPLYKPIYYLFNG